MADHLPNALEKLRAALGTDTGPRLTPGEVGALLADYDDLTDAMREAAVLLGLDPGPHERTARVLERLHELRDITPEPIEAP